MPKIIHDKLLKEGKAKGLKGKRLDAYVYGTLNKIEGKGKPMAKKKTMAQQAKEVKAMSSNIPKVKVPKVKKKKSPRSK